MNAGPTKRHVAVFVVIGSPKTQGRALPSPRGENLETSGYIPTEDTLLHFSIHWRQLNSPSVDIFTSSPGRTQSWYARMKPFQAQWTRYDTCGDWPLGLTW